MGGKGIAVNPESREYWGRGGRKKKRQGEKEGEGGGRGKSRKRKRKKRKKKEEEEEKETRRKERSGKRGNAVGLGALIVGRAEQQPRMFLRVPGCRKFLPLRVCGAGLQTPCLVGGTATPRLGAPVALVAPLHTCSSGSLGAPLLILVPTQLQHSADVRAVGGIVPLF